MDYLKSLNEPQREAVVTTEGPLMIIAGAGSGKTRVLTYRIANLIGNGIEPFNILALTFTNKAAKEMRERIEKVVGTNARNIWMGTFHSVFAKILRIEHDKLGYPRDFTIYDTDDCKSLLRSIIKEMNLDDKVYKVSNVLGRISNSKNKLVGPQQYAADPIIRADDIAAQRPKMAEIYIKYCDRCFKSGAMDFDDLLYNTNVLFFKHLDVLNKYQSKFHYVMVDEFQDTNISQYLITKKLAAKSRNICVVGDDAQSIYAFRGADIQNILSFQKEYPELKIVKLEQNYRSTKNIVETANSIIAKNKAQLQKNVYTANETGELIHLLKAGSDNEEGRLVASSIFETRMQEGLKFSDFAILYRTNSQSRAFEESLRKLQIKYKIVGGLSFYQRKEIKDIIAYLRFTINPNDEEALKRIINYPRRGIGETTVNNIIIKADELKVSLWEIISNSSKYITGKAGELVKNFAILIKSFQVIANTKDAYEAISHVAKNSGILKELHDDKTVEGLARFDNIQELLNAVKGFVEDPQREEKAINSFLEEVSLLTDVEKKEDDDDKDYVTLMTVHSSKGLEFRNVFIVGLEEDLFPSQMMLGSREDLEEERRLFYVAITRAEKRLTLSYANTRYRFGRLVPCEASRFLDEIDTQYLKMAKPKASLPSYNELPTFGKDEPLMRKSSNSILKPKVQAGNYNHKQSDNFAPSDLNLLKEGMKVEHPKFGYGLVQGIDTSGNEKKATVNFDMAGEKTLLLGFAKLMIIEE
jgi:DNA helicase II / ATP-dependent DNA helicase PcrA